MTIAGTIGVLIFAAGTFLEAAAEGIEPAAQSEDQGEPPPAIEPPPAEPQGAEEPE
ncbi:MAG: hypothetical protein H0W55_07440, partial [Actinobacteria bacterium]|nr:hypothetical protein [Actinomycetota bacterium]